MEFLNLVCVYQTLMHFVIADISPVPGNSMKSWVRSGDIMLGGIFHITDDKPVKGTTSLCAENFRQRDNVALLESMVYAIETVNNDSGLLPNHTLGFAILDSCYNEQAVLAQASRFLPRENTTYSHKNVDFFDVVGVIGPGGSGSTKFTSFLFGTYKIPHISYLASTDELSNKDYYPYLLRTVPTDKASLNAAVDTLVHYNWSYVSVLVASGTYGQISLIQLHELTKEKNICIAYSTSVSEHNTDYDAVVQQLIKHSNARTIIIWTFSAQTKKLFQAIRRANATNMFVFIGGPTVSYRLFDLYGEMDVALGMLMAITQSYSNVNFDNYMGSKDVINNPDDPWFKHYWELIFECSWNVTVQQNPCNVTDKLSENKNYRSTLINGFVIDAVNVFAHALDSYIKEHCPGVSGPQVQNCIERPLLLEDYMLQTEFKGSYFNISFDSKGDVFGQIAIQQVQLFHGQYTKIQVATWDLKLTGFVHKPSGLVWNKGLLSSGLNDPESTCSKPCQPGEYIQPQEIACCWTCKKCNDYEIPTNDSRDCERCPKNSWPESTYMRTCEPITPTFLQWDDPLVTALVTISIIYIVALAAVFVFFAKNSQHKLIKASSRELSLPMLAGMFLGICTVFLLFAKPCNESCFAAYFGFTVSLSWMYGPLLVKTSRIYRVFKAGKKSKKPPMLVSRKAQIVLATTLVLIQIATTLTSSLVDPPTATLLMPVITEKRVEVMCYFPTEGFIACLVYNLFLVVLCSIYAYLTRKLPDNFNESRFIAMSVYTTLIIWLVFITSYFLTNAFYRVLLLALCLILNAVVALSLLYLPKVYAVLYGDTTTLCLKPRAARLISVSPSLDIIISKAVCGHNAASVNQSSEI